MFNIFLTNTSKFIRFIIQHFTKKYLTQKQFYYDDYEKLKNKTETKLMVS